jgi:hypothetical protein
VLGITTGCTTVLVSNIGAMLGAGNAGEMIGPIHASVCIGVVTTALSTTVGANGWIIALALMSLTVFTGITFSELCKCAGQAKAPEPMVANAKTAAAARESLEAFLITHLLFDYEGNDPLFGSTPADA